MNAFRLVNRPSGAQSWQKRKVADAFVVLFADDENLVGRRVKILSIKSRDKRWHVLVEVTTDPHKIGELPAFVGNYLYIFTGK
jgi:hypothetical protein